MSTRGGVILRVVPGWRVPGWMRKHHDLAYAVTDRRVHGIRVKELRILGGTAGFFPGGRTRGS